MAAERRGGACSSEASARWSLSGVLGSTSEALRAESHGAAESGGEALSFECRAETAWPSE